MSFCENCISYDMCNYEYEHQDTDAILTFFPNNSDCPWFKNKADFVEVVRCKGCKHYDYGRCSKISYIMDGYYQGSFEVKTPTDFCSYGERRENNDG